jgi:3-hydroxyacyl-[acyl-carrier-protein] dehydratase
MLNNKLFTIKNKIKENDLISYRLALNPSHEIFQAHFAGNPVLPGACIVQTVKELAADYCGKDFIITKVKNTKFLAVINPLEHSELIVQMTISPQNDSDITVAAVIRDDALIFSKINITIRETT